MVHPNTLEVNESTKANNLHYTTFPADFNKPLIVLLECHSHIQPIPDRACTTGGVRVRCSLYESIRKELTVKMRLMLLVLLVLLAGAGCAPFDMLVSHPDEMLGQAAPELTLSSLGGASVSLNDFSGQVVLVNIWASWCGPCRIELPHIQDLHRRYGGDGLVVLAINAGESEERIGSFLSQEGLTLPVLLDPESRSLRAFSSSGIPTVVLIDGEGIVRHVQVGYGPGSDQELERKVQALLAED